MRYKILGFAVWQAGKWYLRRKLPGTVGKVALVAGSAAAVGGLVAARRQQTRA